MNLAWAVGGAVVGMVAGAALRGLVLRLSLAASGTPRAAASSTPPAAASSTPRAAAGGTPQAASGATLRAATDGTPRAAGAAPRVAGGIPRAACPRCGAALRSWPGRRCPGCGHALTAPAVLELVTAAVLALLCGRFAGQPVMLALGFLGVLGVALAAIDIRVQRLPDRLTLPAYPVLLALLAAAALIGHDLSALVRALLGGLVMAGGYLLLGVARPGQLGGGDIKLAGLAGLVLGWLGWRALLFGAALGFVLAAMASLVLLAAHRVTLRGTVSFGPYLLGGALLAILAGGPVGYHIP